MKHVRTIFGKDKELYIHVDDLLDFIADDVKIKQKKKNIKATDYVTGLVKRLRSNATRLRR